MSSEASTEPERWPWADDLDAVVAAPGHHVVLLENAAVRVLETRIPPGETTPVHTHRWPNVQHILSTSDFVRRDEAGEVVIDTRTTGELPARSATLWSEPLPPHSLENVGETELLVLMVELKNRR
jgi:hypothetical protein